MEGRKRNGETKTGLDRNPGDFANVGFVGNFMNYFTESQEACPTPSTKNGALAY